MRFLRCHALFPLSRSYGAHPLLLDASPAVGDVCASLRPVGITEYNVTVRLVAVARHFGIGIMLSDLPHVFGSLSLFGLAGGRNGFACFA